MNARLTELHSAVRTIVVAGHDASEVATEILALVATALGITCAASLEDALHGAAALRTVRTGKSRMLREARPQVLVTSRAVEMKND